jgi:AcrR family transcriptional regulator
MSAGEVDVRPSKARSAPARSRAATRGRLVQAGTELFAAEGLHAVTTTRIARRAGVATGTFYLHFRDKQTLFREIVFEALGRLRARQDRAARETPPGSLAEARARTEELLAFAEENRSLIRVLFGRGAESVAVAEEVLDDIVPGVARRLTERLACGEAPPDVHPDVAAQALAAMTTRVIAWWVEDPSRATREQVVATLLRMHPSRAAEDGAR